MTKPYLNPNEPHACSTPREVAPRLLGWVGERANGGTPVLIAHNGRGFDLPMLHHNLARVGAALPGHWWYLDTFRLAQASRLSPDEKHSQARSRPRWPDLIGRESGRHVKLPGLGGARTRWI